MDCEESLPEEETIHDVPKILSPELRDIFPILVNMLDIKSFMKLAVTSKDMYKRCMEDKAININVNEDCVEVFPAADSTVKIDLTSSIVDSRHIDSYLSALRRLPCTVNLNYVEILAQNESEIDAISAIRRYLEEIGVNRMEEFNILGNVANWEPLVPFVKDFKVKFVCIEVHRRLPLPILQSVLLLNLNEFSYNGLVTADVLLEISSPIQLIYFGSIYDMSNDQFMQLLWKIQSGSLNELKINFCVPDFDLYEELPFDYEGALPAERPLFITRRDPGNRYDDGWFLHWHGGLTACNFSHPESQMHLFKCEPWEYPWILRKEEAILKDLAEKYPKVYCSASQFQKYSASLTMLEPSHKGPLPPERPLYCKVSENSFWLLEENEFLTECSWEDGCATWEPFYANVSYENGFGHPALAKYVFWNALTNAYVPINLHCESQQELDNWLEGFKKFSFDYAGPLPDERPVVFERISVEDHIRTIYLVILFEEHILECKFAEKEITVKECEVMDQPSILMSPNNIKKFLQDTVQRNAWLDLKVFKSVCVDRKTFLDGFELFVSESIIEWYDAKKHLGDITKSTDDEDVIEERWFAYNGRIRKTTWEKGRLHFAGRPLKELPIEFVKKCFIPFAQTKIRGYYGGDHPLLEREQFNSCLEPFTIVPFEYSGPLTGVSPLAFVKDKILHTCDSETRDCSCSHHVVNVCFLWTDMTTTYCIWGKWEPHALIFLDHAHCGEHVPAALKSKEYLEIFLQSKFHPRVRYPPVRYEWFGSFDDVLVRLKKFKTLPFDYDGPLPEERPLVFEDEHDMSFRSILREDGLFECSWHNDRVIFFVATARIPPATREFFALRRNSIVS